MRHPVWEYYTVDETSDARVDLEALGRLGWELVTVVPMDCSRRFYFKRPEAISS